MNEKWPRLRNWIFSPPYSGVPWLVWIYAALCCAYYSHGGVFAGHLSGFDDHTRMTQVLEWINGHGWYDRTITRANPPEGFTTIWSRIVDIPIATVIVLAQFFTDQRTAALVAAVVIPFVELAILFPVARYFARPLIGKNKAWLIVLFLMFTTVLNFKQFSIGGFQTGEASHHAWYTILDLALFGAAARIALGGTGRRPVLTMAGVTALLLAIGIESIPMIATASALLAAVAWLDNRACVAQRGTQTMLLAALSSLVLLPLHQPPSRLFTVSFVEPSILGPILLLMSAAFLGASYFAIRWTGHRKPVSGAIIAIAGLALLGCMVAAFPEVLNGALAGLSKAERDMAHAQHYEANSLYWVSSDLIDFIGLIMPSVIALVAGVIAIRTAGNHRRRAMDIIYLGFAAISIAMCASYSRYIHHALTSACAWLLWVWEKLKARLPRNTNYALASLFIFVALGPFWMLLLPAFKLDAPILSQVILFPAKVQTVQDPCDPLYVSWYINEHYSKDKTLIVPSWDSSRMLYYTNIRISFVANYPSHDKFIDNDNFFATRDPDEAKDIAQRHDLDLVTVCRIPLVVEQRQPLNNQTMIALLQMGRPPAWLKYVDTQLAGNYVLYQVDKKALGK